MIVFRPMQPKSDAFACGKLILSGEHSVVYGHPAIALPVSRGVHVTLERYDGPTTMPDAEAKTMRALLSILPPEGLQVSMTSTLPIGRGMGSSAAFAVACLRALATMCHEELSFESTFARAFAMERVFHGNPSGVDHAVSASQRTIYFKKEHEGHEIKPLTTPSLHLVVMDTGSAGDTGRMVAKVRAKMSKNLSIINEIGSTTETISTLLNTQGFSLETLGQLVLHNHDLLDKIGVSTPALNQLVHMAMSAGAYGAKLAGSGGGGVAFALVSDPKPVLNAVKGHCYDAFSVQTSLEQK